LNPLTAEIPIPVPGLPPLPKPPTEQNMVGHPQPRTAPSGNGHLNTAKRSVESPEDDESAFLKMVLEGGGTVERKSFVILICECYESMNAGFYLKCL
ncbi:hypothetical protein PoB_005046900, partial [Plakobranchus ocellatus]